MNEYFFPNTPFAWLFCVTLWVFLIIAAYTDTKSSRIPNRLVVGCAIFGLLFSLIRSGWDAAQQQKLWIFDTGSIPLGIMDGMAFSLVGFLLAFFGLFVFWIMGLCGGGDVKLFAAVGIWLGWKYVGFVWMASFILLWIWMIVAVLMRGLSPSAVRKSMQGSKPDGGPRKRKFRVTYSLPIAVAAIGVCFTKFHKELGFQPATAGVTQKGEDRDSFTRK